MLNKTGLLQAPPPPPPVTCCFLPATVVPPGEVEGVTSWFPLVNRCDGTLWFPFSAWVPFHLLPPPPSRDPLLPVQQKQRYSRILQARSRLVPSVSRGRRHALISTPRRDAAADLHDPSMHQDVSERHQTLANIWTVAARARHESQDNLDHLQVIISVFHPPDKGGNAPAAAQGRLGSGAGSPPPLRFHQNLPSARGHAPFLLAQPHT